MGILSGVLSVLTGGTSDGVTSLGTGLVDAIKSYFPPDMTPEQKANIELAAQNFGLQKQIEAAKEINDAEKALDDRIAMYEGSASDLKAIPYLGALMLFLRGAQRPVWGFAALYIDYMVFNGSWKLEGQVIPNAFWVINFLVLGFLFGERAVTNVMPFVTNMIATKNSTKGQ